MKNFFNCVSVILILLVFCGQIYSQPSTDIRLNQIGYYPTMPKLAIVKGVGSQPFFVLAGSDTIFRGTLSTAQTWSYSNESVSIADFSALQNQGSFRLAVDGIGTSLPFEIKHRVHNNLAKAVIKGFYYQRASTPLLSTHAGVWARAAGHPDTSVLVHSSAATTERPTGFKISSPRGWYDAGDYNKYIVNSGISVYSLLATYEHFPEYCSALELNIPESGNGIPDILDETLWNIRWMLTMQDPNDGGVYHKLTNANFDGYVMPHQATTTRYVVMKSTAATLDFAAVMAQTSRIVSNFSDQLPGLADSCLQASLMAWNWARRNPTVYYVQPSGINTGEYGDNNVTDERAWAAAELFVTTGQDSFLTVANPNSVSSASVPGWPNVNTLGLYTFAKYSKNIASRIDTNSVRTKLINLANWLRNHVNSSAYRVVMGVSSGDFSWGSNGHAANQGMALLIAFRLTGDSSYLNAAIHSLDYMLGRNATTYSFVTGYGFKTPRYIHHRPSAADGIAAPVPGLIAGGPNSGRQDASYVTYPSTLPALSYVDHVDSYASNEICINWNAPLVFLTIGLETLLSPNGLPTSNLQNYYYPANQSKSITLFQNYPNPFNPITTFTYQLSKEGYTSLKIFDILGREIATLDDGLRLAGKYSSTFEASCISSGVYFAQIITRFKNEEVAVQTKKIIIAK